MRDKRIRLIAEIGLSVALFALLDWLNLRLPINIAGGSVSLAMAPIVLLALMRGWRVGVVCGVLAGTVDLMIAPYVFSIPQVVLDYPVAFGLVGLAGLMRPALDYAARQNQLYVGGLGLVGVIIGGLARLGAHLISGVIFFASNAPVGENVWWYSLVYNLSYLAPSTVAAGIVVFIVAPTLYKHLFGTDNRRQSES